MIRGGGIGCAVLAGLAVQIGSGIAAFAQTATRPAFVIVERLTTTGPEDIQKRYGEISKSIVAKFGGRYLSRSQDNTLLEGPGPAACCMAIIEFPSFEAAQRWYASPENQAAAKIRQSGATFRIVTIQGLPRETEVR
jgi:uncharacterized protein (DUF1330 family)